MHRVTEAAPTFGLPAMLRKREAAEFLGVSLRAVDRMLDDGTLPSVKLGAAHSAPVRIPRDLMLEKFGLATPERPRRRAGGTEHERLMLKLGIDR